MRIPAKIRNEGMMIYGKNKKELYLNRLIERKENNMIKVITEIVENLN